MNVRIMLAAAALSLLAGCSPQGPISGDGTLPIVSNLTLLEDLCRGDTLFFGWDSVFVEVDDYGLWYSDDPATVWLKAGDFPDPLGSHVADRCHTYSVWAQRGNEHSTALSNRVTLTHLSLGYVEAPLDERVPGFRILEDTLVAGDARDPEFSQDFFIRHDLMGGFQIYGGHTDPRFCPGGRWAQVAYLTGNGTKAPHPDSQEWSDSLYLTADPQFFIRLEDQRYGRFIALVYQSPDTLQPGLTATVLNVAVQPIRRVRLFQ